MKYWLHGKTLEYYIKKALEMEGLTGNALKSHLKYYKYEKFMYKPDTLAVENWLKVGPHGLPMHLAWAYLGLQGISNKAKRMANSAYKVYVRYAKMYDDQLFKRLENGENPLVIVGGNTKQEMSAKIQIWADAERSNAYVKKLLGLDKKNAGGGADEREYFKQFLKLTNRKDPEY